MAATSPGSDRGGRRGRGQRAGHGVLPAPSGSEHDASITVLDAGRRTSAARCARTPLAGLPVDTGPDAFLVPGPRARALVADLGLADDVIEPLGGGSYVWSRGRLRPLPPGTAFGLPERLRAAAALGAALARGDRSAPGSTWCCPPPGCPRTRPWRSWCARDSAPGSTTGWSSPLLGGVHAGDPALLSARSTVPEIAAMARSGRSIYLTLRRRAERAPAPAPVRAPRSAGLPDAAAWAASPTALREALGPAGRARR